VRAISHAKVKTDKVDARVLSDLLAAELVPAVWTGDERSRSLRRLVSRRRGLVKRRRSVAFRTRCVPHCRSRSTTTCDCPAGRGGRRFKSCLASLDLRWTRRLGHAVSEMATLDLNADLGEGFGRWKLTDDAALLALVTSANVACGFHAGDPPTMRRVAALAVERGVAVGAHVAYRDLAGFGRRAVAVEPDELAAEVLYQLGALDACCRAAGTRVRYVKPHGALYNAAAADADVAAAVVEGVRAFAALPVLGLPGSKLLEAAAAAGLAAVEEGFPDRAYAPDGTLVPRGRPGATIEDPGEIAARCVAMAARVRSVCVHGDSPGAVRAARAARAALDAAAVTLEPFA
jgi:5-oxoprolinase (ATP-hydrolysing) subunit A